MKAFIQTPEQVSALVAEAKSWLGTAYVPDGAVKGTGSSCSDLPHAILSGVGFACPPPPRRGAMLKCEILPLMKSWLAEHEGTHFARITLDEVRAGDVLVFDAGIGHLSLALDENTVIHSWQRNGVHIVSFRQSNLIGRVVETWRPVIAD